MGKVINLKQPFKDGICDLAEHIRDTAPDSKCVVAVVVQDDGALKTYAAGDATYFEIISMLECAKLETFEQI